MHCLTVKPESTMRSFQRERLCLTKPWAACRHLYMVYGDICISLLLLIPVTSCAVASRIPSSSKSHMTKVMQELSQCTTIDMIRTCGLPSIPPIIATLLKKKNFTGFCCSCCLTGSYLHQHVGNPSSICKVHLLTQ